MKKNIFIIIGIVIVALAIAGLVYASTTLNKKNNDVDSHLVELNMSELQSKIDNKETFILVISQTDCSHCAEYKPILKEVLAENNITAYEIDEKKLTKEENGQLKNIANISGTPTTVFIVDGEEKSTQSRLVGSANKTKIINRLKANGYIKE
mgnify:CR=1 FL=1